jgi:hypothetical protein
MAQGSDRKPRTHGLRAPANLWITLAYFSPANFLTGDFLPWHTGEVASSPGARVAPDWGNMSRSKVSVVVDSHAGTLTARRGSETSWKGDFSQHDGQIILHTTKAGEIVAVTILSADEAERHRWLGHPVRGQLPFDLLAAIDNWFLQRSSH